jgi:hypothetical protein
MTPEGSLPTTQEPATEALCNNPWGAESPPPNPQYWEPPLVRDRLFNIFAPTLPYMEVGSSTHNLKKHQAVVTRDPQFPVAL